MTTKFRVLALTATPGDDLKVIWEICDVIRTYIHACVMCVHLCTCVWMSGWLQYLRIYTYSYSKCVRMSEWV